MGRLEEARGADAIDLIADLIDPLTEISQDEEILKLTRKNGTPVFKIVQAILRRHKDSAIQILAIIDGVEPEDYKGNVFTIIGRLLGLLSNKDIQSFFGVSPERKQKKSSGRATENTEETEEA